MELNYEIGKAFGLIEPINSNSALSRIKVLGVFENGRPQILQENEIKKKFSPTGYVFAAENVKLYEGIDLSELVQFSYTPMSNKKYTNWDDFIVSSRVKRLGSRLLVLKNYVNNQRNIDLDTISLTEDVDKSNFYALAQDRFILGKLNVKNGQLSSSNKYIKKWDREGQDVVSYKDAHYLLSESPIGESTTLDSLTDKQLIDWFRGKLKFLNPEWVDFLDQKTSWRKDLVTAIAHEEESFLQSHRLEKVMNLLSDLKLSAAELIKFSEVSDQFKGWYEVQVALHKKTFLENQGVKVSEIEKEYQREKSELENGINKVKKQLKENEQLLTKVDNQIKRGQKDLEHLQREKERLLSDFSILDNIVTKVGNRQDCNFAKGYIIEEIVPVYENELSRQELVNRMKIFLFQEKFNPKVATIAIDTFLLHKALFIKNIRLAKCFLSAFGKVKYLIQQTEVDWLHFSNFWENGLGDLWRSAYENPDFLHILILQDINLASPECYSRPLLDMITEFRTRIPFDGTSFPPNFKIIASKASSMSPRIGLPLLRDTFTGWGQIGFDIDISLNETTPNLDTIKEGFIDVTRLRDYYPDDLEGEIIINTNAQAIPELYDQI